MPCALPLLSAVAIALSAAPPAPPGPGAANLAALCFMSSRVSANSSPHHCWCWSCCDGVVKRPCGHSAATLSAAATHAKLTGQSSARPQRRRSTEEAISAAQVH
jgi:hypothetical protein